MPIRAWLASLILLGLIVTTSSAGPFSQLFVFGDSLSDVGNVAQVTASIPDWLVADTPGPYYYNGRFSNGPVYAELLAQGLDLPPLSHSRSGGNNFAHGGAKTSGTGFPSNLAVQDIDDQIGSFLGSRTVDPNALYLVFAGANDLFDGQTNMNVPVDRLATDVGRLIDAGARNFLVPNLPLLGYTPRYNGNSPICNATCNTYNGRSALFNTTLATMLDDLKADNPAITLYRFDVAALFSQAINDPAAFGLTNVYQSAAPGLEPGDSSYNTNLIVPNPNSYMFWDAVHPTAAVHGIVAAHMLPLFERPGDYNHDNVVDAADYVVWRKQIGTADAYDTWQANFGQVSGSGSSSSAASQRAIAEPAGIFLAGVAILAWASGGRRAWPYRAAA